MIASPAKRALQLWQELNSSLWFLPGMLVGGAVALAAGLIYVEGLFDAEVWQRWPLLFGAGREGSRAMLGAIAGSMISVAGVVFSITIVALSLASTQYSPRLLRNFMRDGTTQTVLGSLVGIFVYCLIVLRSIYGGDNDTFVPHLAVLGGLLLAIVGVALLVYFIHHIALSIQAAHILASIADESAAAIDRLYPTPRDASDERGASTGAAPAANAGWFPVCARRCGYIQHIDFDALLDFARRHDTTIRMRCGVGDFMVEDKALFHVDRAECSDAAGRLCSAFLVNHQRTVAGDVGFGIRQIVDMGLRALSPGINDPTTATMCLDRLEALLLRLGSRRIEPAHQLLDGRWYVIACGPRFDSLIADALEQITEAAVDKPVVLRRLAQLLASLADAIAAGQRSAVLADHADRLVAATRRGSIDGPAADLLAQQVEAVAARLRFQARGSVLP